MTDDKQARMEKIARQFMEALPHCHALGIKLESLGGGRAKVSLPYAEHLVGDPQTGVVHGGAVSALMDTCGGAAVMSHPAGPGGTATIDLRIDYMRAAKPGQTIVAEAECFHITRSVAFVRATAVDDDTENPVATMTGAFTVEKGMDRK